MEQALTARGCLIVREFLSTLCTLRDNYGQVNVTKFIKEYRNLVHGQYSQREVPDSSRKWTKDKLSQAQQMHDAGKKWKDVAIYFGCTRNALVRAIQEYKNGKRRFSRSGSNVDVNGI